MTIPAFHHSRRLRLRHLHRLLVPPSPLWPRLHHRRLLPRVSCADYTDNCLNWARAGECKANPGFMLNECRQSCGACDAYAVRLGAAETCGDDLPRAQCTALVGGGACVANRQAMQEECREACGFCNRSAVKEPPRDTANHGCPDGSDLGGGAYSQDPPPAPPRSPRSPRSPHLPHLPPRPPPPPRSDEALSQAAQHPQGLRPRKKKRQSQEAQRHEAAAAAVAAAALEHRKPSRRAPRGADGPAEEAPVSPALERRRRLHPAEAAEAAEPGLPEDAGLHLPFTLVQGLLLVLVGFVLRGWVDRARRRSAAGGARSRAPARMGVVARPVGARSAMAV